MVPFTQGFQNLHPLIRYDNTFDIYVTYIDYNR